MAITPNTVIEKFKATAFTGMLAVSTYFGIKVLERVDKINDTLEKVNINVQQLNIYQEYNTKQFENHEMRIRELEIDNTRVVNNYNKP
jgi:hypothetical protein